jgi:hypothetical protein
MSGRMSAIGTKRTLHRDRAMSLLEVKQTWRSRRRCVFAELPSPGNFDLVRYL